MLYLVNWVNGKNGHMVREGVEILEAKSVYDAKSKFLRTHWEGRRIPMSVAVTQVKAKCLEDERFAFPLSDRSFQDPDHAYD